jgi:hypothetical protein
MEHSVLDPAGKPSVHVDTVMTAVVSRAFASIPEKISPSTDARMALREMASSHD